jgi:hypothetical protein
VLGRLVQWHRGCGGDGARRFGDASAAWQAMLFVAIVSIAGCQARRPSFMTRIREDCTAGDKWSCDLLEAFNRSKRGTVQSDEIQDRLMSPYR